jgi:hypothetical protein
MGGRLGDFSLSQADCSASIADMQLPSQFKFDEQTERFEREAVN